MEQRKEKQKPGSVWYLFSPKGLRKKSEWFEDQAEENGEPGERGSACLLLVRMQLRVHWQINGINLQNGGKCHPSSFKSQLSEEQLCNVKQQLPAELGRTSWIQIPKSNFPKSNWDRGKDRTQEAAPPRTETDYSNALKSNEFQVHRHKRTENRKAAAPQDVLQILGTEAEAMNSAPDKTYKLEEKLYKAVTSFYTFTGSDFHVQDVRHIYPDLIFHSKLTNTQNSKPRLYIRKLVSKQPQNGTEDEDTWGHKYRKQLSLSCVDTLMSKRKGIILDEARNYSGEASGNMQKLGNIAFNNFTIKNQPLELSHDKKLKNFHYAHYGNRNPPVHTASPCHIPSQFLKVGTKTHDQRDGGFTVTHGKGTEIADRLSHVSLQTSLSKQTWKAAKPHCSMSQHNGINKWRKSSGFTHISDQRKLKLLLQKWQKLKRECPPQQQITGPPAVPFPQVTGKRSWAKANSRRVAAFVLLRGGNDSICQDETEQRRSEPSRAVTGRTRIWLESKQVNDDISLKIVSIKYKRNVENIKKLTEPKEKARKNEL
ncbi:hypothetical protein E5288_WYG009638 [Bos mutus]|uniref:Uncharacterized protein n=1 Tax=Bos mutus TaxID=72004 RepID=A0A6B0R468_9CETA|nr:hypothetical protein [Bos mutus]